MDDVEALRSWVPHSRIRCDFNEPMVQVKIVIDGCRQDVAETHSKHLYSDKYPNGVK